MIELFFFFQIKTAMNIYLFSIKILVGGSYVSYKDITKKKNCFTVSYSILY